jgi:prepilin-type N-terminal cleavage/methylation domain-containing protein
MARLLPSAPSRPGYTLVEVVAALVLLAVALAMGGPRLRGLADRSAVLGAREALVGLVGRARMAAVVHGGASLTIRASDGEVRVRTTDGDSLPSVLLGRRFGVTLTLSRSRQATELRFDALGLGRIASETISLRRGSAEGRVVVSGYGRVRRP